MEKVFVVTTDWRTKHSDDGWEINMVTKDLDKAKATLKELKEETERDWKDKDYSLESDNDMHYEAQVNEFDEFVSHLIERHNLV